MMSLGEAVCARDLTHNQLIYRPLSVTCNICGSLTDISLARIFILTVSLRLFYSNDDQSCFLAGEWLQI